jgi:hypothetical protein
VSLDGATLREDIDENEHMYGKRWQSTAYRDAFNLANRVKSDESSLELPREGTVSEHKVSKGDYT